MSERIRVGILGATGVIGQRFVQLLANHPWFELAALTASDASAGKRYGDACRWRLSSDMPATAAEMVLRPSEPGIDGDVVFSALPAIVAGPVEEAFAAAGHRVFSNASSHRLDPDVPLLVPEVNPDHAALIHLQRAARGWGSGFIVTNPNCSSAILTMTLAPLQAAFGLRAVLVTTLQALSGAGLPGVPALDTLDNVIPFIGGEEEKLAVEPRKMLGTLSQDRVEPADLAISAQCHRVAVLDGHLEAVSAGLARRAEPDEVVQALQDWNPLPQRMNLPSAPHPPIVVRSEPDRPQSRLDRDAGHGMAVSVGRIRRCDVLDIRLVALGHNAIRGAAGVSILNAELFAAQGMI